MFKSYPLACPSRDSDAVASAFIEDLHSRMPSVCGEMVKFSSKALAPLAELNSATEHQKSGQSNAKPFPRAVSVFGVRNTLQRSVMLPAQTTKGKSHFVKAVNSSNSSSSFGWFQKDSSQIVPISDPLPLPRCPQHSSTAVLKTNEEGRIVPVFRSTSNSTQSVPRKPTPQTQQRGPAIVPSFKATNIPHSAPHKQGKRAKTTLTERIEPPAKRPCFENHARRPPVNKPTPAAKPVKKRPPQEHTASRLQGPAHSTVPDYAQRVPDLSGCSLPSLDGSLSFSEVTANTPTKPQPQKSILQVGVLTVELCPFLNTVSPHLYLFTGEHIQQC